MHICDGLRSNNILCLPIFFFYLTCRKRVFSAFASIATRWKKSRRCKTKYERELREWTYTIIQMFCYVLTLLHSSFPSRHLGRQWSANVSTVTQGYDGRDETGASGKRKNNQRTSRTYLVIVTVLIHSVITTFDLNNGRTRHDWIAKYMRVLWIVILHWFALWFAVIHARWLRYRKIIQWTFQ